MTRISSGTVTRARHKKVFRAVKGYKGRQKNVWRIAKQAHMKAGLHAYVGRKLKKRQFRSLWAVRINAAARSAGTKYSELMHGLKKADIQLNRKSLAGIAMSDEKMFASLVEQAKKAIGK